MNVYLPFSAVGGGVGLVCIPGDPLPFDVYNIH